MATGFNLEAQTDASEMTLPNRGQTEVKKVASEQALSPKNTAFRSYGVLNLRS